MKKVVLYAYDKKNLGDDLFVHIIVKRYSNVQFLLWSYKENKQTFRSLKNLKVIDRDNKVISFFQKLHSSIVPCFRGWQEAHADAVVYIGGSVFIEYDTWKQMFNWWKYEAEKHSLYIIGANFGPYKSEKYPIVMGEVFEKAEDVCFRDKYSYELFSDKKVRYAPDILFNCQIPDKVDSKRQIFISVINCEMKGEGECTLEKYQAWYLENLRSMVLSYIQDGYEVVLASFCKSEGDEEIIEKLKDSISARDGMLHELYYDGTNVEIMLQTISNSEYIIASRFHAAILGIAAEKPIFPIVYSDKTIHVLQDIGFEGVYADIRDMKRISYEFSKSNWDNNIIVPVDFLKKSALKHFSILDRVLK